MHELGIAFHIIKEIDKIAEENHASKVTSVTLEVGEVSGIVPQYMEDVWKWACLNKSAHMKDCALQIIVLKATSYCEDCKETYDTVPNGKTCPHCQSKNTYLVRGNETTIQSIKVSE